MAIAALGATALPATAASAAPQSRAADSVVRQDPAKAETVEHNFKGPLSDTQSAQRQQAIEQVISGESKITDRGASGVVKLDNGKYIELQREKTDKIFTILAEFGDSVDPRYGGTAGPAHNEIAQPDRATDNSTAWQADYNQQHFQDLYFSHAADKDSLAKFYEKESSGRYSVEARSLTESRSPTTRPGTAATSAATAPGT